ncbi:ATP-binding protein [Pseudoalteromonas sp. T1lg65]|uniref:ATP-binding protein n=1 Tax=Pseudoalteromonas sp. T1lg65 TaxID=2077101 RepID=UPI003F79FBA0
MFILHTLSLQLHHIRDKVILDGQKHIPLTPSTIDRLNGTITQFIDSELGASFYPRQTAFTLLLDKLSAFQANPSQTAASELANIIDELLYTLSHSRVLPNHISTSSNEDPKLGKGSAILVIDDKNPDSEHLTANLQGLGYAVHQTSSDSGKIDAQVDMVLLKWNRDPHEATLFETLLQIKTDYGDGVSILLMAKAIDIELRLKLLRLGVDRFIQLPCTESHIFSVLNSLAQNTDEPYRAILVDDSRTALALHSAMLKAAGFETWEFNEPFQVFEHINKIKPDVMIFDFHMPKMLGPELAILLKEQPMFVDVPIVFLSSDTEYASQLYALKTGADDFLLKPVNEAHFCGAISVRARRYRVKNELKHTLQKEAYERDKEHLAMNSHAIVSIADHKGTITYVNDSFCAASGYTRDELIGQNHRIVKSGIHDKEFYNTMWQTISEGNIWHGEICNKRKDGGLYWVNATIVPFSDQDGRPYQYISIRTDITTNKMLQEALKAIVVSTSTTISQNFFDEVLESLAIATNVTTSFISVPTGNPDEMRTLGLFHAGEHRAPYTYNICGTPCGTLEGKHICFYEKNVHALFPEDSWLKNNNIEAYIAVRLISPDGEKLGHIGLMSERKLRNADYIKSLLTVFADRIALELIRVRNEEQLISAKEAAVHANKAKSEFLSNISHELRTPLNAILGFGQLLESSEYLSSEDQDDVQEILKASKHLLSLINEILDLSKVEAGKLQIKNQLVDISEMVLECAKYIEADCKSNNISLQIKPINDAYAWCDPLRLKQVLLNILSNAIKYNRQDGQILISTSNNQDDCQIEIKDTGIGIAHEDLDKLYEPFNRLGAEHSDKVGTGIGLTLTKKLVHLMKGKLDVKSELGVGSTFTVSLRSRGDNE